MSGKWNSVAALASGLKVLVPALQERSRVLMDSRLKLIRGGRK
jgi:hypothetical protein